MHFEVAQGNSLKCYDTIRLSTSVITINLLRNRNMNRNLEVFSPSFCGISDSCMEFCIGKSFNEFFINISVQ